jgi:hypothetical protein
MNGLHGRTGKPRLVGWALPLAFLLGGAPIAGCSSAGSGGSGGKFDASAFPPGVKPGNPEFDAAMQAYGSLNPDPNGEIHAH